MATALPFHRGPRTEEALPGLIELGPALQNCPLTGLLEAYSSAFNIFFEKARRLGKVSQILPHAIFVEGVVTCGVVLAR